MQCILDIDLDFFVAGIKTHGCNETRLSEDRYTCDSQSSVRVFIEEQCGLSKNSPVPGRLFENHSEVFKWWRTQIQSGQLTVPFHCIHVDAHADLGMGDSSYDYISTELLHRPLARRSYPKEGFDGLNDGSFLAFALACRWIGRLTMVRHRDPIDDLHGFFFRDFDPGSGFVSLKRSTKEAMKQAQNALDYHRLVFETDHEIPCDIVERSDFKVEQKMDLFCLTRSPGYTPLSADSLFEELAFYIAEGETQF